jgi:hypothetical protein
MASTDTDIARQRALTRAHIEDAFAQARAVRKDAENLIRQAQILKEECRKDADDTAGATAEAKTPADDAPPG